MTTPRPASLSIIVPTIPPHFAGGGWRAFHQACALADLGIPVEIITSTANPIQKDNLTITTLSPPPHTSLPPRLWLFQAALRHLSKHPPRVVHAISYYTWPQLVLLAAQLLGIPIIVEMTLASADDPATVRAGRAGILRHALMRRAKHFVSISPLLDKLCAQDGIPQSMRSIIPNGVDMERFQALSPPDSARIRRDLELPHDAIIALYVGVMSSRKRVIELVEAFAPVARSEPRAMLCLVGPTSRDPQDGEYHERLLERITQLELTDRIRFEDLVERPQDWMGAADLFVFASSREGFGNVQVEAMSAGIPVIARRIEDITEYIITHEVDGMIVDDTKEMTSAWMRMVHEPLWREALGDRARETISTRFSQQTTLAQYLQLYEQFGVVTPH